MVCGLTRHEVLWEDTRLSIHLDAVLCQPRYPWICAAQAWAGELSGATMNPHDAWLSAKYGIRHVLLAFPTLNMHTETLKADDVELLDQHSSRTHGAERPSSPFNLPTLPSAHSLAATSN